MSNPISSLMSSFSKNYSKCNFSKEQQTMIKILTNGRRSAITKNGSIYVDYSTPDRVIVIKFIHENGHYVIRRAAEKDKLVWAANEYEESPIYSKANNNKKYWFNKFSDMIEYFSKYKMKC